MERFHSLPFDAFGLDMTKEKKQGNAPKPSTKIRGSQFVSRETKIRQKPVPVKK